MHGQPHIRFNSSVFENLLNNDGGGDGGDIGGDKVTTSNHRDDSKPCGSGCHTDRQFVL